LWCPTRAFFESDLEGFDSDGGGVAPLEVARLSTAEADGFPEEIIGYHWMGSSFVVGELARKHPLKF